MESDKYKRRIPQTLRRRALISCDRCKKRRVRCLRSPDGSPEDPCQSCIASGVKCESTLPRKHRIYGSVETLSLRYRALDALVKGLFPDESTEETDTLFRIAEAHQITMPNPEDKRPAEQVLNQYSPPSPTPTQHSPSPPMVVPNTPSTDGNPFASTSPSAKVAEEKLIPTPHGVSHYIGPSSSFGFALAIRKMVSERHVTQDKHWPDRADFVGLRTSKAIEPRVSEKGPDDVDLAEAQQQRRTPLSGDVAPRRHKEDLLLPAREVADALVEAFFEQVHPNYLLFHRGTFQLRYESIWIAQHRKLEPGWICSIFMVFVFGAQALEHHDKQQSTLFQRRYLSLVQSRLHHLINTSSLVNIQALLLLQLFQHNASERNTAWMLLGCASRMAVSLGMHREGATGGFDPIEKQVRRRVWWTLSIFEQNLCMMLGRPSAIDDSHVNVSLPNETMLDGGNCIPPEYIDYTLRLIRISSHIKSTIYLPLSSRQHQDELPKISLAKQLLLELETWHHSLPTHLALDSVPSLIPRQRRAVLLLHIHYHHAHSIVSRPFLLRKAALDVARQLNRAELPTPLDADGLALAHACGTASRHVVQLLHQLATRGMLDGVAWIDVYYAYHSVLALALDFLARPPGQEDSSEDAARKNAVRDIVDVLCAARLCPTFHILAQVAVQFARIVGMFEPVVQEPPVAEVQGQGQRQGDATTGIMTDWLRQDDLGFSWDFFDMGYGTNGVPQHPYHPTKPFAGTFVRMSQGEEDSSPAGMLASPNSTYTGWGGVDAESVIVSGGAHVPGTR